MPPTHLTRTIYVLCIVNIFQLLLHCNKISASGSAQAKDENGNTISHGVEEEREFLSQLIPRPIKKFFSNNTDNNTAKNRSIKVEDSNEVNDKHSSIFGLDIIHSVAKNIQKITKTVGEIGEDIVKTFIPTAGLDSNRTFFCGIQAEFKKKVRAIFPGTLWCGDGNTARSFEDLGTFNKTDNCCRGHDYCFNSIESGKSKYGLSNTGLFTRSHCDCDVEFYECLKEANTLVALKIGYTYFSVLGPQCFKEDYPIVRCKRNKKGPLGSSRCAQYETKRNATKTYQWFDQKFF